MNGYYRLDNHTPVPCELAEIIDGGLIRLVKETTIGDVRVNTVFLGMDHSLGIGPPLLFETMVFCGPLDGSQEFCATWDQAEAMHTLMCDHVSSEGNMETT